MKKHLSSIAALLIAALTFTSCGSDDPAPYIPTPGEVIIRNGAFFIGSGNKSASIMGNLTYYDYANGTAMLTPFETANGIELGMTANDGIFYGSKLYIVVDNENTIFVCNKNNMKIIKRISTTDMLGAEAGISPRHIIADGGSLYFTTYGNVVAKIDTTAFTLQKTYNVGSYPEGLAITDDGNLYVCNSDYGNGNASLSKINLSTGNVTEIKDELINNPNSIVASGNDIYYLDYGKYDDSWNQIEGTTGVRKVTAAGAVSKVCEGTTMGYANGIIYTASAPFGATGVDFYSYNIATGQSQKLNDKIDIAHPAAIGVDPVSGDIFIAAQQDKGGYASYKDPCTVTHYGADFSVKGTFSVGVGICSIFFNTGVELR